MTTYGGRNTFRAGYCSPEDIQHNMQMLSNLSEAIGNPFSEGGPSWIYPQLDVSGAPLYDPDGNQMWYEEPLVTPGGLARFELEAVIDGTGPTLAKLLSKDKGPDAATGEFIYVTDPLSRYHGIGPTEELGSAQGYAQHMVGDVYEILSLGRPGISAGSTLTDGDVRIRSTCTNLKSLAAWFDTVDSDDPHIPGPGRELAVVKQDPDDCHGKLYISVPSPVPPPGHDGIPEEGDIILQYDATENRYWFPKSVLDGLDVKVSVDGTDPTNHLFPKSGGPSDDPFLHSVAYEPVAAAGVGLTLKGEVPFTTHLLVGKTTGYSTTGCPGVVDVTVPGEGDEEDTVYSAKILTERKAEPNHCVLITPGGPVHQDGVGGAFSKDWYVIWYACDEIEESP